MRKKQLIWISLGVLALLLGLFLKYFPSLAESVYGNVVFVSIRWVIAHTLALLPFPVISLIFLGCLWLLWRTAIVPIRRKDWTWKSLAGGILSTIGAAIFLFQFLWGFNYFRPPWDERLNIEVKGMTTEQLTEEFQRATAELKEATGNLTDVDPLVRRSNREHEISAEPELRKVLMKHHFPLVLSPRVRIVKPKGILMRWNTAGIYVPYSGEGHVDAGMLPVQIPFTLAHEMAHGFGVADEGDCNFLAYLACKESEDRYVRFAGVFNYWRYVASEYRYVFPEEYKIAYDQLPELIRTLLADIRANDAKYPDLFPKLRNTVYDTYLKSQGVSDGLQSYSRVVQLVWAYENR
jgi:hypothetical protein